MGVPDEPDDVPPASAGVEVSPCGPQDRPVQAALYDRCFGSDAGERTLPWRYDQNPHGTAITLLARDPSGTPVSGYACSPRRVWALGRDAGILGQTGDVMTDPDHRGRGIFSDLDRRAMALAGEQGWALVFGLPNRQSAPIFVERLGWKEVGRIRPFTFVLSAGPAARAERMRAGRLAAMATPWSAWRGNMCRGRLRNIAFEHVTAVAMARFDESVDELTRSVSRQWPLMVARDHRYLNWRFTDAPSGLFRIHGVFNQEGKLRAYSVVQMPASGEAVGHVVDLVAVDAVAWAGAMEAALGHLSKVGASVARAHAIEGSEWERGLRGAGFRPPKAADYKIVIAYRLDEGGALGETALNPASWFFTDGDRDDELVH